jgi:hypothetical protein
MMGEVICSVGLQERKTDEGNYRNRIFLLRADRVLAQDVNQA